MSVNKEKNNNKNDSVQQDKRGVIDVQELLAFVIEELSLTIDINVLLNEIKN